MSEARSNRASERATAATPGGGRSGGSDRTGHGKWTDDLLDELRREGDPFADAVIADYLDQVAPTPGQLFHDVMRAGYAPDRDLHETIATFRAATVPDPDWLDRDLLARGVDFFAQWGLEIGLGLFCYALPVGYAAEPVARVLDLTGRLETDAQRRVFETAQMVLDVTAPDGLAPGRPGRATARQVRLIHAAVRHLLDHDPAIERADQPHPRPRVWLESWGTPVSQEHLLGTVLAFGHSMLDVLDTLHIRYDERDAEGYLHLWSMVGYLLGVRADLLPIDIESARALDPILRRRNLALTPAGRRLTDALLALLGGFPADRVVPGLPATMMRFLLGDETADLAGVPPASWALRPLRAAEPLLRRLSMAEAHHAVLRMLARHLSHAMMTAFVRAERPGRPAFQIPTHLGWKV